MFLKKVIFISIVISFIPFCTAGCSVTTIGKTETSIILAEKTITGEEQLTVGSALSEETAESKDESSLEKKDQLSNDQIKVCERLILENELKEKQGIFYVPLPPLEEKANPGIKAKGIYVTANSAGLEPRFEDFIDMIDSTELNSMVIDVKNDWGLMTYPSQIPVVQEIMKDHFEPVNDIKALLSRLEEKNIYPIARIVVFRDPHLPGFYPEWAIQKKDGGVWKDDKGFSWMNPYEKKVWNYNIAIAKEAALMGFREIQFDYVRFPEGAESLDAQVNITERKEIPKDEIIKDFLIYASEELKDYNVYVSADVFGVIATYFIDKDDIGQDWQKISAVTDYIYPMVYPSHYNSGFFGLDVPDANPRLTILNAMEDAIKRSSTIKNPAVIRPWLQGFTATWIKGNIKYGPQQIREQIDAVLERGIEEFFVWNASNCYERQTFLTEEEALSKKEQAEEYRQSMGFDYLGNTASDAFKEYLEYVSKKNWRQAYPYQATDFTIDFKQFGDWGNSWTFDSLESNIVSNIVPENNSDLKKIFAADIILKKGNDEFLLEKSIFEVYIENNIWKIKPSAAFIESLTRKYD